MKNEEIISDVVYNLKRLTNLESIDFKIVEQSQKYDYDLAISFHRPIDLWMQRLRILPRKRFFLL